MDNKRLKFLAKAIELSRQNIDKGGGPFGAVIVKDGQIVSARANSVFQDKDPTAHAEMIAIRDAARELETFDLSGCEMYASCEPCPMCMGAIYWANIDAVYYANTRFDAQNAGFEDKAIYDELNLKNENKSIKVEHVVMRDAFSVFESWEKVREKYGY